NPMVEISGQGYTPDQAVLVLSNNEPIGIAQVDPSGNISMTIHVNDTNNLQMKVLETGSSLAGSFQFNGQTLTSTDSSSQIQVTGAQLSSTNSTSITSAPSSSSSMASSTNSSSTNSTASASSGSGY